MHGRLIGGPFDGAHGDLRWHSGAPQLWVRPDPEGEGPFGLKVRGNPSRGGAHYLRDFDSGQDAVYIFADCDPVGGPVVAQGALA